MTPDEYTVELRIPVARQLLPGLLAGVHVSHVQLVENGDGTHELVFRSTAPASCCHDWQPTQSRALERCAVCGSLRHRTFVGADGQARTRTHTRPAA